MPGQSLALLDAQRELIVEMVPCEDGHSQERSLLPQLLLRIKAGIVVVADRNFCTTHFLFGLAEREAFFAIRQHASTLTYRLRGKRRRLGRIATGVVYEQGMELHNGGATLSVRRVSLHLDQPTESGDTEIHIVTNLPAEEVTALQVAEVYGTRWTVEGAFQTLTDVLRCEVETLGYPGAALFSFAAAVLAYNIYAVVKAALRSAHGAATIEAKLSDHHLMQDVAETYVGMDIAVEGRAWAVYRRMSLEEFAVSLVEMAHRVSLKRYPKKKRGPKKPQPRKKSGAETTTLPSPASSRNAVINHLESGEYVQPTSRPEFLALLRAKATSSPLGKAFQKGKGFEQPLRPHEHWHIDVSHINICGTFYFLCSILEAIAGSSSTGRSARR